MDAAGDWFTVDPTSDAFGVERGWLRWALYGYVAVFVSIGAVAAAFNLGGFALEYFNAHSMSSTMSESSLTSMDVNALSGGGGAGVGGVMDPGGMDAANIGSNNMGDSASAQDRVLARNAARRESDGPGTIDAVLPLIGGGEDQGARLLSLLADADDDSRDVEQRGAGGHRGAHGDGPGHTGTVTSGSECQE
jgi:hypothetical protein